MKNLAAEIAIPNLLIDMDMFRQPHRIIALRSIAVIPWAYDKEGYRRKIDSIGYEVSEELFYYP